MSCFVYYYDGHADAGCAGLEVFNGEQDALEFIEERMKCKENPDLDDYTLIEGHKLKLASKTVTTKVVVIR